MIYRRPDTLCKLECVNKFNVVVLINFENNFCENLSSFPFYEDPLFWNLSHLYLSMQIISESHMFSLQKFGWKIWILNYPLHKVT